MKVFKFITNGVLLVIIGILHSHFAISAGGFQKQMLEFSRSNFYRISEGMDEFPAVAGHMNFEGFAAFWFLYFGFMLIPLGLLVHSIEIKKLTLPHYFTWSYLVFVLIGCYMIPNSGITFFMLPHAVYMLLSNHMKSKKKGELAQRLN